MKDLDLNQLTQQIIEIINNTTYQNIEKAEVNEFINNRTELLINIASYLCEEDFENNLELISKYEVETETCTNQKRKLLLYVSKLITNYIKSIMEKNKTNISLKLECQKMIEAINIFLNPENYNSNIEVLKKQRNKTLTLK